MGKGRRGEQAGKNTCDQSGVLHESRGSWAAFEMKMARFFGKPAQCIVPLSWPWRGMPAAVLTRHSTE